MKKLNMKKLIMAMVVLGVFATLVVAASGVFPDVVPPFEAEANTQPDLGYTRFEVDGMPCIVVGRRTSSDSLRVWTYDGVTCDWSKRKARD